VRIWRIGLSLTRHHRGRRQQSDHIEGFLVSEDFTLTVAVSSFWACRFHGGAVCVEFRLVIVRIAAAQRSTARAERAGAILRLCSFSSGSPDVTAACAVTIVPCSYRLPSTSHRPRRNPSRSVPKATNESVPRKRLPGEGSETNAEGSPGPWHLPILRRVESWHSRATDLGTFALQLMSRGTGTILLFQHRRLV
jgi:hypothetical protein